MLKQERKSQQHKVLYRCQHHLYPEKYSYEVLLQDNNVGIVCQSKGDKKTWRQRISLCLVSSLIQRYYFSMSTLWDLLAHSITFIGSEMKFSTQHIVNYHTRKTSKHVEAYIIWQKSKEISPEETWFVEFLSECTGAFTLEMCIRKAFGDIHRYACRIEQSHIAHLFERYCLEPYSDPVRNNLPKEAIEDFPMETNHFLQALLDDLFYDEETDSFMVKFVELSSLENYLDGSEQRTHQKAAPQKTLSALRTDPFGSESGSDDENKLSSPASPVQSPIRMAKQAPHAEVKSKDYLTHYEVAQARRLARNNGTIYDPTAHLASQKERLVHHAAVAEVPELIGQISLKTEFHRRPPAMDRLRTDTELDDLAVSIISEMDLRRDPTEPQPQPPSASTNIEAPLQIDVDASYASYASSPLGTARTVHLAEFFADDVQDNDRLDTEDIDVDDELEHSAAFSALLRRATLGPPGARLNPTFTPTQSAKDPLARKLAELREKYARATYESTVSHTLSDEGSENGDTNTNDYDGSHLEEETDMFRSQCGFEESVKQEEISEILVEEVSAPASVSTAQSEKSSAMRKDFLKNFKKSKFYRPPADNGAAAKAKLKEIADSNKELVLRMMAAAVQKLVDPAKALRTASRRGPITVSFPLVQDALAMHASYRSFVSSSLIIDMFKDGCKLSPFLTYCSEDDLLALCQACTLQDLLPKEKEKEKNNIIEALHLRGEAVLSVYIVMRGQLEVTTYETEDVGFDGPMEEIVETHRLVAGDCIGECALEGTDRWEVDVAAVHTQPISLCCISLEAAQCYIGRRTEESERIICLFWKFHRLWQEIKLHNQEMLLHAKYQKDLAGGPKKRENLHFDFSPMNVISSCRIRVYQPGTDVFTHNRPRHYLYLVLRGCCEYRRTFPENIVSAGLMPPYKEIGKPLMCGDFSFMDGEDHLWLDRMDDQDEFVAGSQKDSAHIREHKLRKYCRFDKHKNSLVATTRVEMAVVPLKEIAKCLKLFVKLIRLATEKYPDTFVASEELVRLHYEGEKWKVDRKDVIRSIAADKEARVLRESYYHSVHNNESDALYKANQPGAKMQQSTLHSIIQHFSSDRAAGGPTDIPPEQLAKQHTARKESWAAAQKVDTTTSTKSNSNGNSNGSHNASFQTERKDSAHANQSNKILDDMNRPRREALEDYFKQFGTSHSRKNSRKWSVSECDTTESGSASQSRRNSTKSTRSNSFVGSPPAGGEKSFKARPPLWISRPSSATGTSARHSVSGSNTPTGEMSSPASRGTFSPRPSQKFTSPPKSASTSVSTTPVVSSRQSNAGRRPSSACGATASSLARMTVAERPFSSQSTRTRQISPPPRSDFPPVKLAPTPPITTSPAKSPGKTRPGAAARPKSAVPLSVASAASLVPQVNHNEHTERPHSTGSSRHFHHSTRGMNEPDAPITATTTTTTSDGDGTSVRIKKKNVGFANFASEFAVDDALAAELNGFVAADKNTASGLSHKNTSALQGSPEGVATSPLRTVPFQSVSPSPALLSPTQVITPAQSPSTGSPHRFSHRYWRIKDETRKQSNRPVPIDPEKFVEAYREFTTDDPRNKFVQEFVTRTLI